MSKMGFYFNQKKCVGCRTCQVACKDKNDLEVGELFRHVTSYQAGKYPNAMLYHYAATCNHCMDPACVAACPMRALEFGPYDELLAAHPEAVSEIAILPESSQTSPCTLIDPKAAALEPDPIVTPL